MSHVSRILDDVGDSFHQFFLKSVDSVPTYGSSDLCGVLLIPARYSHNLQDVSEHLSESDFVSGSSISGFSIT
jgi:hypothetical protein